jgi:hypothetical protein
MQQEKEFEGKQKLSSGRAAGGLDREKKARLFGPRLIQFS